MIHTDPSIEQAEREEALYGQFTTAETGLLIDLLRSGDAVVEHVANLALRDRAQQTPADDATWALTGVPSDGNAPF